MGKTQGGHRSRHPRRPQHDPRAETRPPRPPRGKPRRVDKILLRPILYKRVRRLPEKSDTPHRRARRVVRSTLMVARTRQINHNNVRRAIPRPDRAQAQHNPYLKLKRQRRAAPRAIPRNARKQRTHRSILRHPAHPGQLDRGRVHNTRRSRIPRPRCRAVPAWLPK